MRTILALTASAVLLAGCSFQRAAELPEQAATGDSVRIVLVGDVMLGRGVAQLATSSPDELFAEVRHLIGPADLAAANLESPLTKRPQVSTNENVLIAEPEAAFVLRDAGFDLISLPNNHAGDAGREGVLETIAAAANASLLTVGGGATADEAYEPTIVDASGVRVGVLAFDATGAALGATSSLPGVALWENESAIEAIETLASEVDVTLVSVHGGTEYLPTPDPLLIDIGARAVAAGADIVWGHGAHVIQPVTTRDGAVVATSLGNFLFDQSGQDRTTGALLEVLADSSAVIAYRIAITEHADRRVSFLEWTLPNGAAVWLDGSWWSLVRQPAAEASAELDLAEFRHGDLVAAAAGAVRGDGTDLIVASFRRPYVETEFTRSRPEVKWQDRDGRSAHLGVYESQGLVEVWVAGWMLRPVAELAVCEGSLAVSHASLDDPGIVAMGAWEWSGFGFTTAPELPGAGVPVCGDVDGDGHLEPMILGR